MEQLLLAHELTHALQDQRLDLDRRMKGLRDSTDALLALQAVLEGEATIVMTDALVESVPGDAREALGSDPVEQILDGLDNPAAVEGADGVPEFFVKELVFPYAAGTAWVRQKKKEGGWAAVDAVYGHLPANDARDPPAGNGPAAAEAPRPGRPSGPWTSAGRSGPGLLRHARGVGPRDPPRAGGRRRGRGASRVGLAGRPGRLLRAEGGARRARRRLPLADPHHRRRRRDADRRSSSPRSTRAAPSPPRPTITVRGDVVEVSRPAVPRLRG